jgi:hypothetical protein
MNTPQSSISSFSRKSSIEGMLSLKSPTPNGFFSKKKVEKMQNNEKYQYKIKESYIDSDKYNIKENPTFIGCKISPMLMKNIMKVNKYRDHQIFVKIAKYESDIEWKDFFERCSFNHFPKGFNFKSGHLNYKPNKNKNKTTSIEINIQKYSEYDEVLSEDQLYINLGNEIKDFMKKTIGMRTTEDKKKEKLDSTKQPEKTQNSSSTKYLIERYIDDFSTDNNLTSEQKKDLKILILFAFITGSIDNKKDIIYETPTKIKTINGFYWDKEDKEYKLTKNSNINKTYNNRTITNDKLLNPKNKITKYLYS